MANGTVKWFNTKKGFGFIEPENGGEDVFVHASALERSGLYGLNEGQKVSYELEQDRRTGKTSAGGLQLLDGGIPPRRSFDRDRPPRQPRSDGPSAGAGSGVVKWFNPAKGFGFIQPNDGGADVFVHISAVEQAGHSELHEGQSVDFEVVQDRRSGKLAASNLRITSEGAGSAGPNRLRDRW